MSDDVRDSFTRQRRALIATSVVLSVYLAAGLRFDKINVLGSDVFVTRPSLIPLGLWILWFYFFWRYYQLHKDLADPGARKARAERIKVYQLRTARALAPSNIFMRDNPPLTGKVEDYEYHVTDEQVESVAIDHWKVQYHATVSKPGTPTRNAQWQGVRIPLPRRRDRIWAWIYVAFHTRYFTEYELPYVVGASPVVTLAAVYFA